MTGPARVVIVGGGIAGLTAALAVRSHLPDAEIIVLEGSAQAGGKLRVDSVAGIPVDVGAEAILTLRPEGTRLVSAVGLEDEVISPLTTAAGVLVGGSMHPLPPRTMFGVPSDLESTRASGVLSPQALQRVAGEPDLPGLAPLENDIAVGALVRSRLGDEVLDRLVEPLLGGVYAGHADQLSLRATMPMLAAKLAEGGSLVYAAAAAAGPAPAPDAPARPVFASLRGGVGRLAERLATCGLFEVRTSTMARSIRRTPTGFAVECGAVPESTELQADVVIVATPPTKAAKLLAEVSAAAAAELAAIETASVAITTLAYRDRDLSLPAGSGLLVGAREGLTIKATTFSSQKWPMPTDGLSVLRASVGRAGETEALQRDDADLIKLVRHELRPLIGTDAEPVDALVTRWGGGLPQYAVGHVERVARIRAAVAAVPGLAVCGATYDGVGIPACIASAYAAAGQVLAALERQGQ